MLDRFPDEAHEAWHRLLRDVVGGSAAATRLVAALDRPVEPLLEGVDVEAALAAADGDAPTEAWATADEVRAQPTARVSTSPLHEDAGARPRVGANV